MIPALVRFAEALRKEGLAVSPAELLDASQALDFLGVEQRPEMHLALKATLAKDRRSAMTFDRVFDGFFMPPPRSRVDRESSALKSGEDVFGHSRREGGEHTPPAETPRKAKPKETGKPRLTRRESEQVKPREGPLNALLDRAQRGKQRTGRPGRLLQARLHAETAESRAAADSSRKLLTERMTTDEERGIAEEVPRLVQTLKLGTARRMERAPSGRPWLRRALRRSAGTGGVPFTIPLRAPKRKHTRVVVLADVSFSVARAAGLFLMMSGAFLKLGRKNRVLLFVDRPVDATEILRRWTERSVHATRPGPRGAAPYERGWGIVSNGVSFAEVVEGLKDLNPSAPSDYGTAFHSLLTSRQRPRGRDTILVILGDGRTNRFDPLPWVLEELSRGCRAVLWLAPEPRQRWGSGDSALLAYLPYVDVIVETADTAGLAEGLGELVRRL